MPTINTWIEVPFSLDFALEQNPFWNKMGSYILSFSTLFVHTGIIKKIWKYRVKECTRREEQYFHIFMYCSPGWKIQKMVKKSWLSVKKMWIWCEKYQKKFGLNWRFPWRAPAKTCSLVFGSAICQLHVICKAICGPKKFHPVCLTFDPLGLQMTTIAQNDQNLLSI